jgi:hypothetical protein
MHVSVGFCHAALVVYDLDLVKGALILDKWAAINVFLYVYFRHLLGEFTPAFLGCCCTVSSVTSFTGGCKIILCDRIFLVIV